MEAIQNYGMANYPLGFKGANNVQAETLKLAKKIIGDNFKKAPSEINILESQFKEGKITAERYIQMVKALMGDKYALIAEAKEMVKNGEITKEEYKKGIAELFDRGEITKEDMFSIAGLENIDNLQPITPDTVKANFLPKNLL